MDSRTRRIGAAAVSSVAVLIAAATACSDDSEAQCIGEDRGDVGLSVGIDQRLPAGGNIGTANTNIDDDPAWLSLSIRPASQSDQDAARQLHLGESFTVAGTTYTVVGICDDGGYLDRDGGPT